METLEELNQYKPLVTFDNAEELQKIRKHAPQAGRGAAPQGRRTPARWSSSRRSSARRPGEAVDLILLAERLGLTCEGLSFHVGSQTTNFDNYVQALALCANIFKEASDRGYRKMNLLDIGGGFPAPLRRRR